MDKGSQGLRVVSSVFILRNDGAALLQHRDDKPGLRHAGKWTVPGGHCEPGELIEACARREVLEETGYVCGKLELLAKGVIFDHGDGESYYLALFWTQYDGVQPYQCFEGQDLRFIAREGASHYPVIDFLMPYWDSALERMRQACNQSLI
ncbi:MAG: NUDIX domain-containing protein [Bdellovibrionota bacterium]